MLCKTRPFFLKGIRILFQNMNLDCCVYIWQHLTIPKQVPANDYDIFLLTKSNKIKGIILHCFYWPCVHKGSEGSSERTLATTIACPEEETMWVSMTNRCCTLWWHDHIYYGCSELNAQTSHVIPLKSWGILFCMCFWSIGIGLAVQNLLNN